MIWSRPVQSHLMKFDGSIKEVMVTLRLEEVTSIYQKAIIVNKPPGRGGSCDIWAWDAFYLAVFWMLNTIGRVTFIGLKRTVHYGRVM